MDMFFYSDTHTPLQACSDMVDRVFTYVLKFRIDVAELYSVILDCLNNLCGKSLAHLRALGVATVGLKSKVEF